MKERYEVPAICEIGAAEIVVQGEKTFGGADGASSPKQLDVMELTHED